LRACSAASGRRRTAWRETQTRRTRTTSAGSGCCRRWAAARWAAPRRSATRPRRTPRRLRPRPPSPPPRSAATAPCGYAAAPPPSGLRGPAPTHLHARRVSDCCLEKVTSGVAVAGARAGRASSGRNPRPCWRRRVRGLDVLTRRLTHAPRPPTGRKRIGRVSVGRVQGRRVWQPGPKIHGLMVPVLRPHQRVQGVRWCPEECAVIAMRGVQTKLLLGSQIQKLSNRSTITFARYPCDNRNRV